MLQDIYHIYMDFNASRYISIVRFGSTSAVFCCCGIFLLAQFNEHFLLITDGWCFDTEI